MVADPQHGPVFARVRLDMLRERMTTNTAALERANARIADLEREVAALPAELDLPRAAMGTDPATPSRQVFVCGCPRSGTSALSWAIAAAPGYWTFPETYFFYNLLRPKHSISRSTLGCLADVYAASLGNGGFLDAHEVTLDEFLTRVGSGLQRLIQSRSTGAQWVDQSPENILVVPALLRMFPDALVINVVRDPRYVCRSMLSSGFAAPWATSLQAGISTWKAYAEAGRAAEQMFPASVLRIHQEDMRQDPDAVAAQIGERLGIADPSPIARFLKGNTINSSYDRGPRPSGLRLGLLEAADKLIAHACRDVATHYGYGLGGSSTNRPPSIGRPIVTSIDGELSDGLR